MSKSVNISKLVIHTTNIEQYNLLMIYLEKKGYKWASGSKPTALKCFGDGARYIYTYPDKTITYSNTGEKRFEIRNYRSIEFKRLEELIRKASGKSLDGKAIVMDLTIKAVKAINTVMENIKS